MALHYNKMRYASGVSNDAADMKRRNGEFEQDVLAVLRRCAQPQSAYDLLRHFRSRSQKLAPTTVYRALHALIERGDVHRLESKRAFIACKHRNESDSCVLAICEDCGSVEEHVTPHLFADLAATASQSGFFPARHVVEVYGQCMSCGQTDGSR